MGSTQIDYEEKIEKMCFEFSLLQLLPECANIHHAKCRGSFWDSEGNHIKKSISAYSGNYRPTDDALNSFISYLKESGVKIDEVKICNPRDGSDTYEDGKVGEIENAPEDYINDKIPEPGVSEEAENTSSSNKEDPQPASVGNYKRTLLGGLQSPRADVPKKSILQRINSKKASKSYQLGHQLSHKWSTGAGPGIGCVADYPIELRLKALEMLNLSPKVPPSPSSSRLMGGLVLCHLRLVQLLMALDLTLMKIMFIELVTDLKIMYASRNSSAAWVGSGPEFFISLADHKEWRNAYIVFGSVLSEDMEILDKIA
ncbi:hypothetical protein VNO78_22405 [Psophocarpus tetragonolobus]|uniref:Uncharacterized protein n=1 Tax=Psophocarpus tetragonolobus TaxID=3891 RepID=A0AAN9SDR7_PSOTE